MDEKDEYGMRNKTEKELIILASSHGTGSEIHHYALMELRRREDLTREDQATQRHEQIHTQLIELKKPHWTVVPTFWFAFISAIAAIVACIIAWLA